MMRKTSCMKVSWCWDKTAFTASTASVSISSKVSAPLVTSKIITYMGKPQLFDLMAVSAKDNIMRTKCMALEKWSIPMELFFKENLEKENFKEKERFWSLARVSLKVNSKITKIKEFKVQERERDRKKWWMRCNFLKITVVVVRGCGQLNVQISMKVTTINRKLLKKKKS